MGKLFYARTIEHLVKSKKYKKDKRKKVKLVSLIDRKGVQWWYLFIGIKLMMRTKSRKDAEAFYGEW